MRSLFLSVGSVPLVLALSGCGGNVVFVGGDGSGGSGSSSSVLDTTSTQTSMSSVMTDAVSTTTGTGDACQKLCSTAPQCINGGPGSCLDQCAQAYVPGCEAETDALINCVADFFDPMCNLPPDACQFEINAYSQCTQPQNCENQDCSEGPSSCSCSGFCNGSNLQVDCKQDMNGASCDCYFDGSFGGSCFEPSLSCDLASSCCFFDAGGPQ